MKQTTNYKLKKPEYTDVADIADINSNMDILDKEFKEHTHTKTQVGLGNVDNTADSDKNVLSAKKLATARKINNANFNGTSDITVLANPQQNMLTNESLDNIVDCGFYYAAGGNTVTNFPTGAGSTDDAITVGGFTISVTQSGGTSRTQIFTNNNGMWFRVSNNLTNKTWNDWVKVGPFIFEGAGKNSLVIYKKYDADLMWANGDYALSAGLRNIANGNYAATIGGISNTAYGQYSTVFGGYNNIAGSDTGNSNETSAFVAGGNNNIAVAKNSAILGGNHLKVSSANQFAIGQYNKLNSSGFFVVGNGTSETARDNAFRVDSNGDCYGKSAFKASGADFAEYFEWADGNPSNEDRRGLFVTLDGEKIRLANADDDYILGVVSATPTITGDTQSEAWKDMYLKDIFGVFLTEKVTVPEITNEETGEIVPEHTETRFIINPDYNSEKQYNSRDKRKEWEAIGLIGKLIVVDDGTCVANGYCNVSNGGIATKSNEGYRVMSRLDNNHIKIILK